MNAYNYDSIVSRAEADALKEMIFKRARERAEALDSEVKSSYTSNMQSDIMDLARESFVASKNPFSMEDVKTEETAVKLTEEKKEIGFPERKIEEIKSNIVYRNKAVNEQAVNSVRDANMAEARADFNKKKSFMGALNFLNSQASIALIKAGGKSFEAIA